MKTISSRIRRLFKVKERDRSHHFPRSSPHAQVLTQPSSQSTEGATAHWHNEGLSRKEPESSSHNLHGVINSNAHLDEAPNHLISEEAPQLKRDIHVSRMTRDVARLDELNSTSTYDVWLDAYNSLSTEDKQFPAIVEIFEAPTDSPALEKEESLSNPPIKTQDTPNPLETLLYHCKEKRDLCESRCWAFDYKGRRIVLRDLAGRVVDWLENYKKIGDIVSNVNPMLVGLPWACARICLQICSDEREALACLLVGLETVICLINRCKIYEKLYLTQESLKGTHELDNLRDALVKLYTAILAFLIEAIKTYGMETGSRMKHSFLNPKSLSDTEARLNRLEQRVETEAGNCERAFNRSALASLDQQTREQRELIQRQLVTLDKDISAANSRNAFRLQEFEREERNLIQMWVSSIPYEDNHSLAKEKRIQDTGDWIMKRPEYKEWRDSKTSMILWLHGIPGAGKTLLITNVVDSLIAEASKSALAYFYCERSEDTRRRCSEILKSFVKQLAFPDRRVLPALRRLYEEKRDNGFASAQLSIQECNLILRELIMSSKEIIFVLDALDECPEEEREQVIEIFNGLVALSGQLKILVSSRRNKDIREQLEMSANIGVEATDNATDIALYIDNQMKRYPIKGFSDDLKGKIRETLLVNTQGMFIWAVLQIERIKKLSGLWRKDVNECLGKLPRTLEELYREILCAIESREGSYGQIATVTFRWLRCAKVGLTPNILLPALDYSLDEDTAVNNISYTTVPTVLDACENLVTFSEEQNTFHFAHLSVEEFLERDERWTLAAANEFIALCCMRFLRSKQPLKLSQEKDTSARSKLLDSFTLYAALRWQVHVRHLDGRNVSSELLEILYKFVDTGGISPSLEGEIGPERRTPTGTNSSSFYDLYLAEIRKFYTVMAIYPDNNPVDLSKVSDEAKEIFLNLHDLHFTVPLWVGKELAQSPEAADSNLNILRLSQPLLSDNSPEGVLVEVVHLD